MINLIERLDVPSTDFIRSQKIVGMKIPTVDFHDDGVQGQYHIGQVVIHHAQNHRAGGTDQPQRPDAKLAQQGVDDAGILE